MSATFRRVTIRRGEQFRDPHGELQTHRAPDMIAVIDLDGRVHARRAADWQAICAQKELERAHSDELTRSAA
jgi:hypothetical protein